jgi:hypothetical protein
MSTIQQAFERFDRENPAFYRMFCRFTLQLLAAGHNRLSSKLIVERIRWETMLASNDNDFKVNNNFTPYFARKFMSDFPNHEGVFETRATAQAA